ncbi:hypothetical protein T261_6621 [Streptomyces lydicus]|nr:hypothetical protein T261_6621 [Streptomyces lydicus]
MLGLQPGHIYLSCRTRNDLPPPPAGRGAGRVRPVVTDRNPELFIPRPGPLRLRACPSLCGANKTVRQITSVSRLGHTASCGV